jgi:ABC-type multidrug transport system permease subunit
LTIVVNCDTLSLTIVVNDWCNARIMKRDNTLGIVDDGSNTYILAQGNESDDVIVFTRLLKTFFESNRQVEGTDVTIKAFGVKTPPAKMLWTNLGMLLTTVLAGMLIALNIVDEKTDHTVSAINVTPISRGLWLFGKSLIGILLALTGSLAMVLIMGVANNVNFLQLLIFVLIASLISMP